MQVPAADIFIPKPRIFNFKECLWFLDRGFNDCLHDVSSDHFVKLLVNKGKNFLLKVSEESETLRIQVLNTAVNEEQSVNIRKFIIELLDLDRDLSDFYQILESHSNLNVYTKLFNGLRLIGIPDLFEALCWSVIGQQINLHFAYKMKRNLVERWGNREIWMDKAYYSFPSPEQLIGATREELKEMQFSRQKMDYILTLAQLFHTGEVSKEKLLSLRGTDQMRKTLLGLKGIGIWTANYAMLKSLKDLTAIPYGDSGLKQALKNIIGREHTITREVIDDFFMPFKGWEGYLVIYLWRSLTKRIEN